METHTNIMKNTKVEESEGDRVYMLGVGVVCVEFWVGRFIRYIVEGAD
jgi:hypothetical protein